MCFLLPLIFLLLSIIMAKIGESYRTTIVQSVVAKYGHLAEPIPDSVALARFIDYALNAPAWVAAWNMPHVLPIDESVTHWGIMRYEAHWWYFIFVALMWFLVGVWLDRYRSVRHPDQFHKPVYNISIEVFLIAYGSFMSYSGFSISESFEYARWFEIVVCAWGAILVVVNLYLLLKSASALRSRPAMK